jgi:hypothetical protein
MSLLLAFFYLALSGFFAWVLFLFTGWLWPLVLVCAVGGVVALLAIGVPLWARLRRAIDYR